MGTFELKYGLGLYGLTHVLPLAIHLDLGPHLIDTHDQDWFLIHVLRLRPYRSYIRGVVRDG